MEAAFSSTAFGDPERAETNLRLVEGRLPPGAWARLATLLGQVPDPDEALNDFERYLRELTPPLLAYIDAQPAAMHYLLLIFSHSRFLSETLIQQPDLILWLHRPAGRAGRDRLARLHSPEDLREELARFWASKFDISPSVLLARFKRHEYLRIMLRDVLGLGTLAETTLELSHLADVLLEAALVTSEQRLTRLYGPPQFTDAAGRVRRSRFVVLSLGKLGGQELNYSSDIDLLFLYEEEGQTAGGEADAVPNAEYFSRLASAAFKIISNPSAEGAVFRVDLRLRPEGSRGDIAVCLPSALHYYRTRARQWELQMLIKARPSAGNAELGRHFLRQVHPLIFHVESREQALTSALEVRREMERELRRRSASPAARNVKLSPGGIRDIEFLAQCLQRIYGGTDTWLAAAATGSTLVALQRLHDKGHLSGQEFFRLGSAYQFFRQVEHRLQLRDGLQVHSLPPGPAELDRVARCLGIEPAPGRTAGQQMIEQLERHFSEVREIYVRILERRENFPREIPSGISRASMEESGLFLGQLPGEHTAFARAAIEEGRSAGAGARRTLSQFLGAATLDPELLAKLDLHPEWVGAAGRLVARSDLAAAMLARHPEEVEIVADPDPRRIERAFQDARRNAGSSASSLDDLRVAQRQAMLLWVTRSATGVSRPWDTFEALTRLAEQVLEQALARLARELAPGIAIGNAPFTVLAFGRLGVREMDLGSDVDLVFVVDERLSAEERGVWRKLAERLVNAISSHTRQGLLYPVDTRLRPRGVEGEIVQPASYMEKYCAEEASGWEAISFNKGRPLAGNRALGETVMARIRRALRARYATGDGPARLRAELAHMRELLAQERRARRGRAGLKIASGGYHDLEYALGFRTVASGVETGGKNLLGRIAALQAAGALDASSACGLSAAATLFHSVNHALRLVAGHAFDHPLDPTTNERVALLLGEWGVPEAGRFPEAIAEHCREVVRIYEALVEAPQVLPH
ncbi:MAG TPA: DUF294 nucleotidyltransferase-like domain-containing protein [Candidatus Dormibacteraeota bacterium]|nr:DUF294 nucleotidyltransferase-like domain-containing protein [Candidatus Dormibacteraeota bacterium]